MGFQADHLLVAPSARLRWLLGALHATAMVAVLISALPGWLQLGLVGLVVGHGVWTDRRVGRLESPEAVHAIRWDAERLWIRGTDRTWLLGDLQPQSFIHPCLMLLEFSTDGGRRRAVLLPDSLGRSGYRRLLVVLRYRRSSRQPQS